MTQGVQLSMYLQTKKSNYDSWAWLKSLCMHCRIMYSNFALHMDSLMAMGPTTLDYSVILSDS